MILPVLFEQAMSQSWRKMRRMLSKDKWQQMVPVRDGNGMPLLHICIAFDAPLSIIKLIHSIDSTQITERSGYIFDSTGMTPLQIACRRFQYASVKGEPDVVNFLLALGCDVAETDDHQRVALHHALECICHDRDMWIEDALELVDLICEMNPSMILAEDKDGMTPIDMVHDARLNTEEDDDDEDERLGLLYLALQKVSVALYKKQRFIWERDAYKVKPGDKGDGAEQQENKAPNAVPEDTTPDTPQKQDSFSTWKTKSSKDDGSFFLACTQFRQEKEEEKSLRISSGLSRPKSPFIKRLSSLVKKRKIVVRRL